MNRQLAMSDPDMPTLGSRFAGSRHRIRGYAYSYKSRRGAAYRRNLGRKSKKRTVRVRIQGMEPESEASHFPSPIMLCEQDPSHEGHLKGTGRQTGFD